MPRAATETRRRILILSEAVTLAHVARPLVLGTALAEAGADVTLAIAPSARSFAADAPFEIRDLASISGRQFLDALRVGRPVYDAPTLKRYVQDDLRLIDAVRPDLVVGDFRLSLSVSTRVRGIPYLAIANAYWSPYFRSAYPLPVLPWTHLTPLPIARVAFRIGSRFAMPGHCDALNEVREAYGLPPLARELRRIYTDADAVAYPDIPEFFPLDDAPEMHRHIGPILWSPPVTPPGWWFTERERLDPRPAVYLSMGSSGNDRLLGRLVDAIAAAGARAWIATAGRPFDPGTRSDVHVANWLPGVEAAACADLVVCNGGSLGTQQALCGGTPVLGIAQNMDQFLNMEPLVAAGVGRIVRADRATPRALGDALAILLRSNAVSSAAVRWSQVARRCAAGVRFLEMVHQLLGTSWSVPDSLTRTQSTGGVSTPAGIQRTQGLGDSHGNHRPSVDRAREAYLPTET